MNPADRHVVPLHQLGFGTGGLFRIGTSRERQRLLAHAWECGFRHFDTARLYGLGEAEGELGRFLADRRSQAVVVTKVGLCASPLARLLSPLQGLIRPVVRWCRGSSRSVNAAAVAARSQARFDLPFVRRSVETSLRALGTGHIDLLLLHEPELRLLPVADLLEQLGRWRDMGRILDWGIAGDPEACREIRDAHPALARNLQVADRSLSGQPVPSPPPDGRLLTFGVLSGLAPLLEALPRAAASTACAPGVPADREALLHLALIHARSSNPAGTILISSSRPDHISAVVRLASQALPDEALSREFRAWVKRQAEAA